MRKSPHLCDTTDQLSSMAVPARWRAERELAGLVIGEPHRRGSRWSPYHRKKNPGSRVRGGVFEDRGIDKWGRRTRDERGGEGRGADGLLQGLGGHGDMGWLQGASGRQDLPDGPAPPGGHHPPRGDRTWDGTLG